MRVEVGLDLKHLLELKQDTWSSVATQLYAGCYAALLKSHA